jgi:hypothetical protein
MARVPYLDKSDLAPENQDLLARNITLHRALAHSPNGLRAFGLAMGSSWLGSCSGRRVR